MTLLSSASSPTAWTRNSVLLRKEFFTQLAIRSTEGSQDFAGVVRIK